MRTAREVAHGIVCERQDSEWCHWTTDRTVHAHYCDSLTAAIEARDAEHAAERDRLRAALEVAKGALDGLINGVEFGLKRYAETGDGLIAAALERAREAQAALPGILRGQS